MSAQDVRRVALLNSAVVEVAKELAGEHWDGANAATRGFYMGKAKAKYSKRVLGVFHASLKEAGLEP